MIRHRSGNDAAHTQTIPGAAAQRNQGVAVSTQPVIAFFDDDILFEAHCLERLWAALVSSPDIGGVSAMITNLRDHAPGRVSRWVYWMFEGHAISYAGRVLGPAVNLRALKDATDVVHFNGDLSPPEVASSALLERCDALLQPYLNPPANHHLQYQTHFPSKLGGLFGAGDPSIDHGPGRCQWRGLVSGSPRLGPVCD